MLSAKESYTKTVFFLDTTSTTNNMNQNLSTGIESHLQNTTASDTRPGPKWASFLQFDSAPRRGGLQPMNFGLDDEGTFLADEPYPSQLIPKPDYFL